jgi:chemotaxis protein MotB
MAGKAKGRRDGGRGGGTIVVRRVEEGGHGHHGGAWKVAYADFVTAMMAFFLLMWLLNATTEEQRRGLADFFAPPNLLGRTVSGSGQPFGGQTPHDAGNMTSTTGAIRIEPGPLPVAMDVEEDDSDTPARPAPPRDGPPGAEETDPRSVERTLPGPFRAEDRAATAAAAAHGAAPRAARPGEGGSEAGRAPPGTPATGGAAGGGPVRDDALRPPAQDTTAAAEATEAAEAAAAERLAEETLRAELARREAAAFERAAEQLRAAVRDDPALADLARQLLIEQTPEGMRIQILDAERQPMFALGGSAPNERARALLARVAQAVAQLPNAIGIAGHTDATPFRDGPAGRSNWDLSAERANATRRLLVDAGVAESRIRSVAGHAEREPLIADQPTAPGNRRVAITLLRQAPPPPAEAAPAR